MQETTIPIAVDIPEACKMSSLGRDTIYKLIKERKIVGKKSGRRTLVVVDSLRDYIAGLPGVYKEAA
ncbi:helix-turn-helix domain-containing protein [Azospirillum sp. 11R-A]|uniref:helix-turn-helix domain-containing protein n=1 Tax=Azospirillum sp. 11R-A TaxID=3111634 RepID=UPI003C204B9D